MLKNYWKMRLMFFVKCGKNVECIKIKIIIFSEIKSIKISGNEVRLKSAN